MITAVTIHNAMESLPWQEIHKLLASSGSVAIHIPCIWQSKPNEQQKEPIVHRTPWPAQVTLGRKAPLGAAVRCGLRSCIRL